MPIILRMRDTTHALGMSFGAADTDLLPMSDSACCCSGADMLLRGGNPFEFNYLGAVRRAASDGTVTFASLGHCWEPEGNIARMMNSRSRIRRPDGTQVDLADRVLHRGTTQTRRPGQRCYPTPTKTAGLDPNPKTTLAFIQMRRQLLPLGSNYLLAIHTPSLLDHHHTRAVYRCTSPYVMTAPLRFKAPELLDARGSRLRPWRWRLDLGRTFRCLDLRLDRLR